MTARKNITLKKFKLLRKKPEPSKTGVTYSVEKIDGQNYIVKKYVKAVLFDQKVISEKKLKGLMKIQMKKSMKNKTAKRGGNQTQQVQQVQQIQMQDNTSMWTTFKQSLAGGFGLGLGIEAAGAVFDGIFEN